MASARRARRSIANGVFVVFCYVVTAIALVALTFILWSLMTQGLGGLNLDIFTKSTPAAGTPGGLINAIVGSIMMCTLGMVIALGLSRSSATGPTGSRSPPSASGSSTASDRRLPTFSGPHSTSSSATSRRGSSSSRS